MLEHACELALSGSCLTTSWTINPVRQDLLSLAVRAEVENLMRSGCFVGGGAGPVCSSFSKAITPPVRTPPHPEGIAFVSDAMKQKIADGNSFAAWTAKVIRLATTLRLPLWLENPDGSWLWQQPCMQAVLSTLTSVSPYGLLRVDYCRFGTPWRKRARFLTTVPCVFDVCLFCAGCRAHTVLRGHAPNGVMWTRIAEPCPHGLCTVLASALAVSAGLSHADTFDACRIADSSQACIPPNRDALTSRDMPRRGSAHRGRRGTDISEFANLTPETLTQQRLSLEELDTYLLVAGVTCSLDELVVVPPLFAEVLRASGVHLYRMGRPLYIYLMAVTAIQRLHPALRVHFGAVWSLAESWRCLELTVHRIPVPLRLFQAVCAAAISLGWLRFAGICMKSFLGPARIGEPMRAKRMRLVLPEDTLFEHTDKVFSM